jgi:hypothetical protein
MRGWQGWVVKGEGVVLCGGGLEECRDASADDDGGDDDDDDEEEEKEEDDDYDFD